MQTSSPTFYHCKTNATSIPSSLPPKHVLTGVHKTKTHLREAAFDLLVSFLQDLPGQRLHHPLVIGAPFATPKNGKALASEPGEACHGVQVGMELVYPGRAGVLQWGREVKHLSSRGKRNTGQYNNVRFFFSSDPLIGRKCMHFFQNGRGSDQRPEQNRKKSS